MARRKTSGNAVADRIAQFIGKSMGDLVSRKEALQRQLAEVEGEMADVRDRVVGQFTDRSTTSRKASRKAPRSAGTARREISAATRAKMAEAAKLRWARAKKAAKSAAKA